MSIRKDIILNDKIYNEILDIMDAENDGEPTSKGISRVINYLLVLGIERYYELLKLPPPEIPFDFDKRMGHDYNAEPSYFERKKKRLIQKLIENGRTYYENFL